MREKKISIDKLYDLQYYFLTYRVRNNNLSHGFVKLQLRRGSPKLTLKYTLHISVSVTRAVDLK